ncbi:MAG: hypothetical protein IIW54_03155 [Lachnospiraceae bacterium]|nr:hypothetical protein [Lachnospiraceae bacterium]
MGKEHSHDVIKRLVISKEDEVMRGLLSIDRIFEVLCVETTEDFDKVQAEILAYRQHEEAATGVEIFLERLLVQCIGFWNVGIIKNKDDLHGIIKISMPVELGEKYEELIKNEAKEDTV